MEQQGLLFIPDISGFTRFVHETEISHSRLIIQELLEVLIDANRMGLEVSEIEGDAILFYKFGSAPDLKELYGQVAEMFLAFHRNLIIYDYRRYCQCKACQSAINLTLKVISHYGEFTGYQVRQFEKLIGKDVIVAHQLLKNNIDQHEYWLVTRELLMDDLPAPLEQWMHWRTSEQQTESGTVPYHYTQLGSLKQGITPDSMPRLVLSEKVKVISVSADIPTDIITLFHATGDFSYRSRWQQGVKAVEEVNHFLPRVGMRCKCIRDNGQSYLYSSSYSFTPERIEFSETEEETSNTTYFTLEKTGDQTTRLTIDRYRKRHLLDILGYRLGRKKKEEAQLQQSINKLSELVKDIRLPAAG